MSVSPIEDAAPEDDEASHALMALDDAPIDFGDTLAYEDHPISPHIPRADSEDQCSPVEPSTRHPTFVTAPRFKIAEVVEADTTRPPLPEAFSPQRRGTKYVTGGLAAEVRDWLVQVKGASEYDRPTGESIKLIVDQVNIASHGGMYLISGDETESGNGSQTLQEDIESGKGQLSRVILAGDGRIPGLGSRTVVSKGVAVSMYQPMWDITLKDLGRFAVACDWDGEGQIS